MNQILILPVLKYTHRKKKKNKLKIKQKQKNKQTKKPPKNQNSTILPLQEKKRTTTAS